MEVFLMKLIGLLIVLGGVLAMTYFLAQGMGYLSQGEGDKATFDISEVTGKVINKVDDTHDNMQKRLDEIGK
jgi:hypothetical protein